MSSHYIGKTSHKWRMTRDEMRKLRRDLAEMLSEGRLPATKEILDVIADAVDESPKRGSPGLHPIEKINQANYWRRCTILVAREIQRGKPYSQATKIVAKNEDISLANLRKHVTSKMATPIPSEVPTVFGLPYNERNPRKLRALTPEQSEYMRRVEPLIESGLKCMEAEQANGSKGTISRKRRSVLTSTQKRDKRTIERVVKAIKAANERRRAAEDNQDGC
jgi:hypothetical protein